MKCQLGCWLRIGNALPAERPVLELLVGGARRALGDYTNPAAAIGRHQAEVAEWAADSGGNVRTGLEDNIRISATRLAPAMLCCPYQDRRPCGRCGDQRSFVHLKGR